MNTGSLRSGSGMCTRGIEAGFFQYIDYYIRFLSRGTWQLIRIFNIQNSQS